MPNEIIFAGSGHGGIVAFKSLQAEFTFINVITDDSEIISLFRNTDKKIENLNDNEIKIVVCAGYYSIISEEILNKKIIINTHPSLLPKYRGMHGLVWGMLNFEEELGFSIHLMNKYIDDGDILEQFKIKYENQTSQEIMKKFDDYVLNNLGRVVKEFLVGKIIPQKQNRYEATWVCKRNIDDCVIDFSKSNKYINMLFKALVRPYPLPMIRIKNKLYEISTYQLKEVEYEMHLGRVINIEDNKAYIKVLEGILIIETLLDFETKEKISDISKLLKIGQRL
jgi:methionyl-tRNA formyltransferase